MKTSGVSRLSQTIGLMICGMLIHSSVNAQLYYASQQTRSNSAIDNQFTAYKNFFDEGSNGGIEKYLSVTPPVRNPSASAIFPAIFTDKDSVASVVTGEAQDEEVRFRTTSFTYPTHSRSDIGLAEYPAELLLMYARSLKDYAKKHGFDTTYAFLSNMGMLSNKKRFFVVNLCTMTIEQSGLVSQGRGQGATIFDKQYSNQTKSRCTALGRYEIMDAYVGSYGQAYKMTGLDTSNNNAFERKIVLHSMRGIPDADNLFPACVSDGCPAVSINFLASIKKIIDSRKKPMLLWVFDSNLEAPVNGLELPEVISAGVYSRKVKAPNYLIMRAAVFKHLAPLPPPPVEKVSVGQWFANQKKKILKPNRLKNGGMKSKKMSA